MRRNRVYWLIVVGVVLAVCLVRIGLPGPFERLRNTAFDVLQQVHQRSPDGTYPVRIVDIDEASIAKVGRWPWRRDVPAQLVDRLIDQGARVIAFDFVFPSPETRANCDIPIELRESIRSDPLRQWLAKSGRGDDSFVEAVRNKPVILGGVGRTGSLSSLITAAPASFAYIGNQPRRYIPAFPAATLNFPNLQRAATGLGMLNWFPQQDQIVRRVPMLVRVGQRIYPSLVAETLRVLDSQSTITVFSSTSSGEATGAVETGITSIAIGERQIATDATGQAWVHFSRHDKKRYL